MKIYFLLFYALITAQIQNSLAQSDRTKELIDFAWNNIANKSKADSLAKLALQIAHEHNEYWGQFQAMHTLGRINEYHQYNDSASMNYTQAIQMAEAEDQRSDVAKIYLENSYVEEASGDREAAIISGKRGLEIYKSLKDSVNLITSFRTIGWLYNNGGYHADAIDHYMSSLRIAEHLKIDKDRAQANQGIGIIYNKQKDFVKAAQYFEQAMSIYKQMDDTAGMLVIYNDLGILNKNKGNFEQAKMAYDTILSWSNNPSYSWSRGMAYNNLGILYFLMKDYENAIQSLQKGADFYHKSNNQSAASDALNYLAKSQLEMGYYNEAKIYAEKSLELAQKAGALEKERDVLLTLSTISEKVNEYSDALEYYKKHKRLYDSIYDLEKTGMIHELERKYEAEKKEKEISILQKDADLAQIRNTRLWIIIIASVFLASLVIWIQRARRIKQIALTNQERKISELESKRLNQELDFKKQQLNAKILQLCSKNEFLDQINQQLKVLKPHADKKLSQQIEKVGQQVERNINSDTEWEQFFKSYEEVHPKFLKELNVRYPSFTSNEYRLACLLKINLDTKEIASLLNITSEGVKKAKYRMRKKMTDVESQNLNDHFMKL